jgi:AcrR family transcriptional regulator
MGQDTLSPLSDRKQQILDAARDLFSRKGYQVATMRDLAEELKIKPASLYSHYASKDEMLWEIAVRAKQAFFQQVLPLAQLDAPVETRLREMVMAHVGVIIENINASAIFFGEWKHLNEPRRSEFGGFQDVYEKSFQGVIDLGIETGSFRPQNSLFAARSLLSGINWIHKWYKARGSMTAADIADQAAAFSLAALKA